MQVAIGFSISQQLQSAETQLFTPRTETRGTTTVNYSGLIESLRAVVSLPSLGPPGAFPANFGELQQDERSEAYRQWLHSQPRKLLQLLIGDQIWAQIPMINRVPWYEINLMPYLSDQTIARIAPGQQFRARLANAGFGLHEPGDSILIKGFGIQEAFIEDFAPQFDTLQQQLSQQISILSQSNAQRLSAIEQTLMLLQPQIGATAEQSLLDGQAIAQIRSDIQWMRQNWGTASQGGSSNNTPPPTPLTSVVGCPSPSNPAWGKFRTLPPGTYKLRIEVATAIEPLVPTSGYGGKMIEVGCWADEPTQSNFNLPTNYQWIADLPRIGGDLTITVTAARPYWGIKVRNNQQSGAYDGVFVSESALTGFSARWIAEAF